jgi:uncharacterized protein YigA (DUF484 family)
MVMTSRTERVSAAFVRITDTLVADHEVPDLLHALVDSTVDLLGRSAACLVLADPQGRLRVVASTSEGSRVVIEQAKGAIAYMSRVSAEEAFGRLRSYARSNNQSLEKTALQVTNRTLRL